ncbi:MAG: hypothetical protein IPL38_09170 [Rhodobacter sp.]|nr:hypothetical protein [Rhodobacter sp.]
MHMLGVLDAFAIALFRAQKTKVNVSERSVDLLKKSFRKEIGISEIDELIEKNDSWLMRIKENLRNRYVHRIPPYVPDGRFTPDEMIKFSSLEKEKFDLIEAGDFGGAERLRAEQDAIGVFEPVLSFSEDKSYMLLHPTILDDTFRFVCLVFDLLEITLPLFSARRSPE